MHWNRSHLLAALVGVTVGFVALLGVVAAGIVSFPPAKAPSKVDDAPKPVIKVTPAIQLPAPLPNLGREALLAAFATAADAASSGTPPPGENAKLVDRKFSIRLPFGCSGAMEEPSGDGRSATWAGWSYNSKTKALKVRAGPEDFKNSPWIQDLVGEMPFEAVEGFWIRRPWSSAQSCPAASNAGAVPGDDHRETVAIAQFFSPASPRALRRGTRPYAFTTKLAEPIAPDGGFGLVIEGRVAAYADGQPVHCKIESADLRPICLMAVEFARVAIENAAGEMLTEWRI